MLVPKLDLSWPPKNVDIAIQGARKWIESGITSFFSPAMRLEGPDILDQLYAALPPQTCIIPDIKVPANRRIDDPLLWDDIYDRITDWCAPCEDCCRKRSNIAMLDIEQCVRPWAVEGKLEFKPDLRTLYNDCTLQLAGCIDQLWIHPSVHPWGPKSRETMDRTEQLCRAIELGFPEGCRPRIRWITQRFQGEEVLSMPLMIEAHNRLMKFARHIPVAKLYFYTDPNGVDKWWDNNEVKWARQLAKDAGMEDCIIYPGVANWLNCTSALIKELTV